VDRTRLATLSLHISAVLFSVAGVLLAMEPFTLSSAISVEYALPSSLVWCLAGLSFGLAVVARVLITALRQRKRWAWLSATLVFAIYLPSALLPLGAVGLFALMSAGTRVQFPRLPRKR
jgi:hypothetical protein